MDGSGFGMSKYSVLKETFGYDSFRPGQEAVVDALLAGRDALAVMPTGSGKSVCFQVPALVLGGLTVVVSPLIALMQDQVAALRLAGVVVDTINSSADRERNVAAWRRVAAGETRLLYLSPERLMTERMLEALSRLPVRLIAVDEAHCISQWGAAFRPEYEALTALKSRFPEVPIAALTATADETTRADIVAKLFGGNSAVFVTGFDRPNILLGVEQKRDWKRQLVDFVEARKGDSGIVYCLSRRKTEEAAGLLQEYGVRALAYHAGLEQRDRAVNQDVFLTEPGVVMVATIAFGMGIDKPDVRYVFHCDIPGTIEAYYQEIGRAGRDGLPAEASMLYGLDDIRMRRMFIENEDSEDDRKRREHKRLDALIGYCETPECRRQALLGYFGERPEPCGNCDVCLNPVDLADGSEEGRRVLEAVTGTGERFGQAHVIDVLRGSRSEKITGAGHDRLPVFGTGADRPKEAWRSIVRQMVAAGFLNLDIQGYGGLKMTGAGGALLRGEKTFRYRPDVGGAKPSRKTAAKAAEQDLSADEAALLTKLKEVRLALARERGVPAFVIFADKSLHDMARRKPQTKREFAEVHGVGEAKLKEFADVFIDAIGAG